MLHKTVATGEAIANLLDALEPVLDGQPKQNVVVACLSIVILLQRPDIDADELKTAVFETSKWMSLYLTSIGGIDLTSDVPKEKLN